MTATVYLLHAEGDRRGYVGVTRSPVLREQQHRDQDKLRSTQKVREWISEIGSARLCFSTLLTCQDDEDAEMWEQRAYDLFQSVYTLLQRRPRLGSLQDARKAGQAGGRIGGRISSGGRQNTPAQIEHRQLNFARWVTHENHAEWAGRGGKKTGADNLAKISPERKHEISAMGGRVTGARNITAVRARRMSCPIEGCDKVSHPGAIATHVKFKHPDYVK